MQKKKGLKQKTSIWSINKCTKTNPEGDLQVLSSPDVHAGVVRSDLRKVISVYREQSTCHGRSPAQKHRNTHTHRMQMRPFSLWIIFYILYASSSLFLSLALTLSNTHSLRGTNTSFRRIRSYLLHFCPLSSVIEQLCLTTILLCSLEILLPCSFFPWALSSFLFALHPAFGPLVFHW